ncbi:hypothetical protein BX600DRAFT_415102 [Xylariales sp. PMI_506]|nr:hypothetical protein BX600DRAFT_415102 [Xylariales sp. PMI_506]
MDTPSVVPRNLLKTCDGCKVRKVRCSGAPGPCKNCIRRQKQCIFSAKKLPRRANVATQLLPPTNSTPRTTTRAKTLPKAVVESQQRDKAVPSVAPVYAQLPELYVDHLLATARTSETQSGERPFTFKGNDVIGGNGNIAFFSEARLLSLSAVLKNNKVNNLVRRMSAAIKGRVKPSTPVPGGSSTLKKEVPDLPTDAVVAVSLIQLYFDRVHPIFPFLDRGAFESLAFSPDLPTLLSENKAWAALYHCILALAYQNDQGGGFEPGKGEAWRHFSISLALFRDLLTQPDSLTMLQAMTAMAVFSLGISCLSIEHVIISEAARRAQNLGRSNLTGVTADSYHRVFWVLYSMEKMSSFYFARSSVFVDCDIVYPLPRVSEAVYGDFDWFLTFARHSRLLSRALTCLFSAGVARRPGTYFLAAIDELYSELEVWRMSIPTHVRPGEHLLWHSPSIVAIRPMVIWTHYMYLSLRLILVRATLQLSAHSSGLISISRIAETKKTLMSTSRAILELTTYIDVTPYTPLWIVAGIPIMALFVLFDLVISNPRHPETGNSLALLDIAGGHFSRIEYASSGSLPGSLIAEFAYIAREYVNSLQGQVDDIQGHQSALLSESSASIHGIMTSEIHVPNSSTEVAGPPLGVGASMIQTDLDECPPLDLTATLDFPMYDTTGVVDGQYILGAHVMDLFTSIIPDIDPIFCQMFNS